MNKNSFLYYQSACFLKLPVKILDHIDGFEVILGRRRYFFRGSDTPFNFSSSISVASNKYCMNKVLSEAGLPVPKADALHRKDFKEERIKSIMKDLSFPVVVKPTIGTALGKDVICNITNIKQLQKMMAKRFKEHEFLTLEEFHGDLNSYRVLVFYNKVIGVVQRFPASIVGDGIHNIKELIALTNKERKKLKDKVSLGPIKVDDEYLIRLEELNLTLDMVPKLNETIVLCYTCNSTRGGTMKSLGKTICKENASLLCNASKALNLNIVGFDVICEDISIPIEKSRGLIIEANDNSDVTIHENPMYGMPNIVTRHIMQRLIWRHPISYLIALYKGKLSKFYVKISMLFLGIIAYKLLT